MNNICIYKHTSPSGKGAKRVKQIDPESGEVVKIWDSQTEACEFYNGNPSLISDAIKRNSLTKGYYWKFEDDNTPLIKKKNPFSKEVEQIDKRKTAGGFIWRMKE